MVALEHLAPVGVDLVGRQPEQAHDIRMGAETAMADRDRVLGAEPGRHQGVVHAVDRERGNGKCFDGDAARSPSVG